MYNVFLRGDEICWEYLIREYLMRDEKSFSRVHLDAKHGISTATRTNGSSE